MSGWTTVRLGDLCAKVMSGGTPLRSIPEYYEGGTIPWLKTGEVKKREIWATEEHITERGLRESSAKLIPADSLIVAMYGDGDTAGNVAINKIPLATNQACCNFVLNRDIADYRFVYHYLKGSYSNLVGLKLGGSQQNLNAATLKNFPIQLPLLAAQKKIAGILSAYDDLIANNQRRIALLEKVAEEIYREWFVRLRFPGHERTTVRTGVPSGWERKSIINLCAHLNRGIAPIYDDMAEGMVLNQKCIRGGRIDLSPARHQSKTIAPSKLLQLGDVLINSTGTGTLGRVAQVRTALPHCTVDTHVTIARPLDSSMLAYFGLALTGLETRFTEMGIGSTNQQELARGDIGKVALLVPPKPLEARFHELVWPLLQQIELLTGQSSLLASARDSLLPRLISGRLSVEKLEISLPAEMREPA